MVNFRNFSFPFVKRLKWGVPLSLIGGAAAWSILPNMATQADALATGRKARLFSRSEVTSHSSKEKRIWISFENGVYDITDFVDIHPGGNKILLAAGKAIDPYWAVFIIHKSEETKELLEEYRIGDLLPADEDPSYHEYSKVDPGIAALFENEPVRDDSLIARSERPYNAEAAMESLDPFITRNEKFYVRNHLPVPKIELDNFKVTVEGLGISQVKEYTLEDLKKFPKTEITATIQCAGNRRNEMHNVKPVKGLLWSLGAIGNAKWSGVMLSDILKDSGYKPDDKVQHVHFHGLEGYGASIPVKKATDPNGDVLLAYEMNGVPIPIDHGFPVRVIVPGHVAARSVKWLDRIVLSDEESDSHWQRQDYKGFSPSATLETSNYSLAQSIQELPVQSAILTPKNGEKALRIDRNGQTGILVKGIFKQHLHEGYAWSGGGRGINRVDVSSDGGKTWIDAKLVQNESNWGKQWAWTKWEAFVPIYNFEDAEIICKAVDSSYQSQPENFGSIYNVRGVLSNAWHRVKIKS